MKKPMKRSEKSSQGQSLDSFGDEWVTSSRHPSAEVMAGRPVWMESGRCFSEVRKAIQSKQFLEHLEKRSKFKKKKNPKVYKTKGKSKYMKIGGSIKVY